MLSNLIKTIIIILTYYLIHVNSRQQTHFKSNEELLNNTLTISAYFANAAYCPKWVILNWKCGKPCSGPTKGFKALDYYEDWLYGSSAFIGEIPKQKKLVIAFRGTQNFQGLMTDLYSKKLDYIIGDSKVHSGFYKAYKRLSQPILNKISNLVKQDAYKDSELLLVGHSFGGALATFLLLDLKLKHKVKNPLNLHTFGAPRIGNMNFAKMVWNGFNNATLNGNKFPLLRVTNTDDIITHLPPHNHGFVHAPHEVMFTNSYAWKECQDLNKDNLFNFEDPNCSNATRYPNLYAHLTYFDVTFGLECLF